MVKIPISRRQYIIFSNMNIFTDSPWDKKGPPLCKDHSLVDSSSGTMPKFKDNRRADQNSEECLGTRTSLLEDFKG